MVEHVRSPAQAPRMSAQLARCAFELFADQGFEQVNLDCIAARAGVTKGSLYWHYRNKRALILAACDHYCAQWQQEARRAMARGKTPLARLRLALAFSVDACVIDPRNRLFTTGIFMLMQEDEALREGWAKFYDAVRDFYLDLLTAAWNATGRDASKARRRVDLMLEAMEGLKLRAGFEPGIARPDERRAMVADLLSILN